MTLAAVNVKQSTSAVVSLCCPLQLILPMANEALDRSHLCRLWLSRLGKMRITPLCSRWTTEAYTSFVALTVCQTSVKDIEVLSPLTVAECCYQ